MEALEPQRQRGAHREAHVWIEPLRVARRQSRGADRALENVHRVAVGEKAGVSRLLKGHAVAYDSLRLARSDAARGGDRRHGLLSIGRALRDVAVGGGISITRVLAERRQG